MLVKALVDIVVDDPAHPVQRVTDVAGSPLIALLAAVLVGMFTLGRAAGFTRERISATVEKSLAPIAGILLIVGAGGGFKQTLIDAGVGQMILELSKNWAVPTLLLAWLIAVAIRLATGSATVATISAAGLVAPSRRARRPPRPRCWSWPSGRARCSSATSTTPGSGWSRSTSG